MKLPIGIQTFSKLRETNSLYIDKTKEALDLITNHNCVFLSRPRRFGKSLFLDTLRNIFEGKKEYFKDLYIEDKYDFSIKHPVIKITFSGEMDTKEKLDGVFSRILRENKNKLGLDCDETWSNGVCLAHLIQQAHDKYNQKVVVLVDEYDKPILDNITNKEMREYAKTSLKGFYEILKDSDEYLRFVFLTGVSRFSRVSIFSGLNNLYDISLHPKYGNICGYTQEDIETTIRPLLDGVDLEKLKVWYNGYNFLKDDVYNPFDILLFIANEFKYSNYWFETATPSFLINLLNKQHYYLPNLENIKLDEKMLGSFDIENIDLEVLLYQTGYLTIKDVLQNSRGGFKYQLKIPNKEVRLSLNDHILAQISSDKTQLAQTQDNAYLALQDAKLEDFKTALISLFASIPYENYTKNNIQVYEGFYASVMYAYLSSMGIELDVEQSTNKGKLDMSLVLNNNRYVFEFKVDKENALNQIKENKYYEKYLNENSTIYLVGINFDEEKRNVDGFEWEALQKESV